MVHSPPPSPGASLASIAAGLSQDRALLGHPTFDVNHVAVVGPTSTGGSQALASLSNDLSGGLGLEPIATPPFDDSSTVAVAGAMFGDQAMPGIEADQAVLAEAERVLATIASWYSTSPREAPRPEPDGPPGPSTTLATAAPTGPVAPDDEGAPNDALAAWMLPSAGIAFNYYVRLRRKADVRGRALPLRALARLPSEGNFPHR